MVALVLLGALLLTVAAAWQTRDTHPDASAATWPSSILTTSTTTSTTTTAPSTTTSTTTTAPPPPPPTTAPAPPPVEMAVAPLTGLPVEAWAVRRPAIVSKIDGAAPAMPSVGMELADVVIEVQIEMGFSRYLAVWHSRDPAVIGPHRSARTTDPFLLSLFGRPLFAFSGGNPSVLATLDATPWKTAVGPGTAPDAYFRDLARPFPHNLFARPEALRRRSEPGPWPNALFLYLSPGEAAVGFPVGAVETSAGPPAQFTWDETLGGWRRRIHGRDHLNGDGSPVAPENLVVLETTYVTSFADARSPEAISLGVGRAWVFSGGRVNMGLWIRESHTAPWLLVDGNGAAMELTPGRTWVVLADKDPVIWPPG